MGVVVRIGFGVFQGLSGVLIGGWFWFLGLGFLLYFIVYGGLVFNFGGFKVIMWESLNFFVIFEGYERIYRLYSGFFYEFIKGWIFSSE